MSDETFRPGPWEVHQRYNEGFGGWEVRDANGGCLADVGYNLNRHEYRATAQLMAAAPDLLSALQALADRVGVLAANARPPALNELELIRAVEVLAKATGSNPKEK